MRKIFLLTAILSIVITAYSQNTFRKNTLFGEIAGTGGILSANYERQLQNKPGIGLRIGIGLGGAKPAIPVGVSYMFPSRNNRSFFETGAGFVFMEEDMWNDSHNDSAYRNPYRPVFIPSVGYRHHTPYGLMWRLNYTPILAKRTIPWMFGFSLGWRI